MSPSELKRHLAAYIALRDALGFQMHAEQTLLYDFVDFVIASGQTEPIHAQSAVDWACSNDSQWRTGSAARRLSMARGFLTYLRAQVPETEVPGPGLIVGSRRRKPYLFDPPQIDTLMQAALQARPRGSLRPHTLATLIGLLASTGLRVGEAIRLTISDVGLDLEPPRLHIIQTKFHKSRIVPLHYTSAEQLRRYSQTKITLGYDALSDNFFVSEQGQALSRHALGRWFSRLCRRQGLWPTDEGRRPSLHSLRHSFAVERLRRWYQEGMDVQALLPNLSVYLGHVRPQESFWYLTATPELLTAASKRFANYVTGEDMP